MGCRSVTAALEPKTIDNMSEEGRHSKQEVVLCDFITCYLADVTSKGAWLNRSSIIFAGEDKWSVDPRVSIVSSIGSKREYSLQIQNVDITDDGQYTCSVQTQHNPRTVQIYLTVQGT
ncbi:NEGR1 regulator, partial [Polypterus senegalus]